MSNNPHLMHTEIRWPRWASLAFAGLLSLGLAACGGTETQEPADVGQAGGDSNASSTGATQGGSFSGDPLDDPSSPLAKRVIYFEFNSANVAAEDRSTVSAHAEYLATRPDLRVRLEGHADERGTREFNIALGEDRGRSVQQLMSVLGTAQNQLEIVSYGEERPVEQGHSESAWSANRRVEIVYVNRG